MKKRELDLSVIGIFRLKALGIFEALQEKFDCKYKYEGDSIVLAARLEEVLDDAYDFIESRRELEHRFLHFESRQGKEVRQFLRHNKVQSSEADVLQDRKVDGIIAEMEDGGCYVKELRKKLQSKNLLLVTSKASLKQINRLLSQFQCKSSQHDSLSINIVGFNSETSDTLSQIREARGEDCKIVTPFVREGRNLRLKQGVKGCDNFISCLQGIETTLMIAHCKRARKICKEYEVALLRFEEKRVYCEYRDSAIFRLFLSKIESFIKAKEIYSLEEEYYQELSEELELFEHISEQTVKLWAKAACTVPVRALVYKFFGAKKGCAFIVVNKSEKERIEHEKDLIRKRKLKQEMQSTRRRRKASSQDQVAEEPEEKDADGYFITEQPVSLKLSYDDGDFKRLLCQQVKCGRKDYKVTSKVEINKLKVFVNSKPTNEVRRLVTERLNDIINATVFREIKQPIEIECVNQYLLKLEEPGVSFIRLYEGTHLKKELTEQSCFVEMLQERNPGPHAHKFLCMKGRLDIISKKADEFVSQIEKEFVFVGKERELTVSPVPDKIRDFILSGEADSVKQEFENKLKLFYYRKCNDKIKVSSFRFAVREQEEVSLKVLYSIEKVHQVVKIEEDIRKIFHKDVYVMVVQTKKQIKSVKGLEEDNKGFVVKGENFVLIIFSFTDIALREKFKILNTRQNRTRKFPNILIYSKARQLYNRECQQLQIVVQYKDQTLQIFINGFSFNVEAILKLEEELLAKLNSEMMMAHLYLPSFKAAQIQQMKQFLKNQNLEITVDEVKEQNIPVVKQFELGGKLVTIYLGSLQESSSEALFIYDKSMLDKLYAGESIKCTQNIKSSKKKTQRYYDVGSYSTVLYSQLNLLKIDSVIHHIAKQHLELGEKGFRSITTHQLLKPGIDLKLNLELIKTILKGIQPLKIDQVSIAFDSLQKWKQLMKYWNDQQLEFQGELGWQKYSQQSQQQLLSAYKKQQPKHPYQFGRWSYLLNFKQMTQINTITNAVRKIRVSKKDIDIGCKNIPPSSIYQLNKIVSISGFKEGFTLATINQLLCKNMRYAQIQKQYLALVDSQKISILPQKEGSLTVQIYGSMMEIQNLYQKKFRFIERFKVKLPPDWKDEYQQVEVSPLKINKVMGWNHGRIVKVIQIRNPTLYKKFQQQKLYILQEMGVDFDKLVDAKQRQRILNIKMLYHGTSNNNPELIYKETSQSFNINYTKEGSYYGLGIYFAEHNTYSIHYASKYGAGLKQMLLCDVICGTVYQQKKQSDKTRLYKDAPLKDNIKSHSLTAQQPNGIDGETTIYVVYHGRRAYPRYLITFDYPLP